MRTTLERNGRRGSPDAADDLAAVRVAVLNQPLGLAASSANHRRFWLQSAALITGITTGEPGLDLLVLSGHGPWHTGPDHLEIIGEACRRARVWTAIRTGGQAPGMALLNRDGRVVALHADGVGGTPASRIVHGPGGLRTALTFVGTAGALVSDAGLRGAELVVALRVDPSPVASAVHRATRALAWTQSCFVATANPCGTVGHHRWAGWSLIAGFDGQVLATCEDEECELAVADLYPSELRRARQYRSRSGTDLHAAMRRHRNPTR